MTLYAESSAVLAWLLDEPTAAQVRGVLGSAELIFASDLTLIECDRVLIRAGTLGEISDAGVADRRARLVAAASHWVVLRIAGEVVDRARQHFPGEPVRTLDAVHLASALVSRTTTPGLQMLTLDDRVRDAAVRLGFSVQPE